MDFAAKARRIERKLSRSVDAAIGELVGHEAPSPLEIVLAAVERAEHEVQEVGRGRRVFPFTCVRVFVAVAPGDAEARARVEAVMAGPPSLEERLLERLRAAGCVEPRLATDLQFVDGPGDQWTDPRMHVAFERSPAPHTDTPAAAIDTDTDTNTDAAAKAPRLRLTVTRGTAAQRAYVFGGGRVDIGRRADVLDQRQRLLRTNHVAFSEDGADENRTVSRRHAHIEFVAADGGYRIWDDHSAQGTALVRGGRTIKVPAGPRGVRLAAGDEITLGQARLRVALEAASRRA